MTRLITRKAGMIAALLAAGLMPSALWAQGRAAPGSEPDALLFFQVLKAEMDFANGNPALAYEWVFDAARRTRSDPLFRRAVEIAVQSRAIGEALTATRSWRSLRPDSVEAARTEVQLLGAMNRLPEAAEPLRALIRLSPAEERAGLIAAVPRAVQRASDRKQAAGVVESVLAPFLGDRSLVGAARAASARAWFLAGDNDRALVLVREAQAADPTAQAPALLALELMASKPEAESIVREHFQASKPEAPLRLAYVRTLMGAQRYVEAITQLQVVTQEQPQMAAPFLSLGALQFELRQFDASETALKRYVELAQAELAEPAAIPAPERRAADGEDDDGERVDRGGLFEAWLLLARVAEQRRDFAAAEAWLARIDDPKRSLEVQTRRATLLARQGRVAAAREAVRIAPERQPEDARAKLLAEAGVLREVQRWREAYDVLADANQRFRDDADLIYEQAMVAEKLERSADAEKLLRRVIELKPNNAHAHNALGYSLADRGQRLPEAKQLIARALELAPGDPFITDSLGWVEFRLGNHGEAARLLRLAYASRPDVEIGAHLGEVLWSMGQHDEARRIWRDASARDAGNEVLKETLARLKVGL